LIITFRTTNGCINEIEDLADPPLIAVTVELASPVLESAD
jgi:hypothetical protein